MRAQNRKGLSFNFFAELEKQISLIIGDGGSTLKTTRTVIYMRHYFARGGGGEGGEFTSHQPLSLFPYNSFETYS